MVAVLAALAAAAITALAMATQQHATRRVPEARGLNLGLMVRLARNPLWLLSVLGILLGNGCYLLALTHGALALVQPIMISGLVLGSLFAAWLAGRRADGRLLLGGAICGAGLASLLAAAQPESGDYAPQLGADGRWLAPVVAALGLLLIGAIITALRTRGLPSGLAFATAAGVLFGVTAALIKLVAVQLTVGWSEPLAHWPVYLALVTGPAAFVLSQRALHVCRLLAPVNAVISTVDPLTAVAIGIVGFGERVQTSFPAVLAELLATVVLAIGVVIVTRRGAWLLDAQRTSEAASPGGRTTGWG